MGAAASMNPIIPSADVYKMITVDVDRGGGGFVQNLEIYSYWGKGYSILNLKNIDS